MSEIITATYIFLDTLDNSKLIKDLTKHKQNLLKNKEILNQISNIKKENNNEILIQKKKALYQNNDYKMYMKFYNELSFIILKINKQYAKYTNTKEHHCHEPRI